MIVHAKNETTDHSSTYVRADGATRGGITREYVVMSNGE